MAKPKARPAKPMISSVSSPEGSIHVRKIDNGYVVRHETTGDDGSWNSRETYHPDRPEIELKVGGGSAPAENSLSAALKVLR